jgi:hypothetical protein
MPRPKLKTKRDQQLNIALRSDEFAEIKARADARGMQPVDYARAALLNMRVASYAVVLPSKLERLNHEQLKRIGNNLNQIARQLHTLKQVSTPELDHCLEELRVIIAKVAEDGA